MEHCSKSQGFSSEHRMKGEVLMGLTIHKKFTLTSEVSLETSSVFVYLPFVSSTFPPLPEIKGSKVA